MTQFVLVPGAWLGAWAWKKVVPPLEERGHVACPVTLTGVAERAHLASMDVGMETGIQDVLNVIHYNDLDDVVLVGHSFAGKVAAAVADRAADRIRMVLYLDGFSPKKVRTPQGSFPDEFPVTGSVVPFPEEFLGVVGKDVQGTDRKWLLSKASPLPVRYLRDPIILSAKYDAVKKSYIYCTGGDTLAWYLSQAPGRSVDEVLKERLDGPYRLIESGHYPMITKPRELAEAMISLSGT
ncbi:MAG TPA: alpha/beta hydrolase [Thermoplasmata archaeon]|nr:alpha/beta hydrolase [Thermoplasmata archaeon]